MKTLETERLLLTPWEDTDEMAVALYSYAKDPEVGPAAGWKPHDNPEESMHIIKTLFIPDDTFAIKLKETGEIVGTVGLENDRRRPGIKSKELGYSLGRSYWGRGIMPEAAKAVINYGFEDLGLEIISIAIYPGNERSRGVARKLGFHLEGIERMAYIGFTGDYRDAMVGSILRSEWQK